MVRLKSLLVLCLCILPSISFARDNKYDIGRPLDISERGVNKVLCMKNGNTMLFHFEPGKDIVVKVFDSAHKQVASRELNCRILDLYILKEAIFKGLFEVNGEAVLFIDQEHLSRHGLVRLRFSSKDGTLTDEKLVGESTSASKRTRFYVMNNKEEDNYAILFSTDIPHFFDCKIYVGYYNSMHEPVKEVPIEVDRGRYDYLKVLDAESQPNGIVVMLGLDKTILNGRPDEYTALKAGGSVYEHYLSIYYVPKNAMTPFVRNIDLSSAIFPYYALYTYNPFAKTLNSLVYNFKPLYYRFGLNQMSGRISSMLNFKIDEQDLSLTVSRIKNTMANEALQLATDTNHIFDGMPVKMFTNENGLTTLISLSQRSNGEPESSVRYDYEDYICNIGITQFDDDGREIWGTTLPFAQYFNSNEHFYSIKSFSKRWQEQRLFGDLPAQVHARQFFGINSYCHNRNYYIIYNGSDKDFNNSLSKPGDVIYNFNTTNACYYKLSGKKELTKHYLFGEPKLNEYTVSFIEGADYDDKTGTYASLVQYKRGDNTSLRMAWSHLE